MTEDEKPAEPEQTEAPFETVGPHGEETTETTTTETTETTDEGEPADDDAEAKPG